MSQMNMIEAIRSALDVVMDKDPSVVVLGQDVGYFGGVFRCTDGLQDKYGEHRVIDAPISEGGIIGAAIGMGVNDLRPVAEIQFADYIYPGFDQIVSELGRLRYRTGGEFFSPVTIRTPCGGGIRGGQTHSQSPEAIFAHISGIKTVMPSNPYEPPQQESSDVDTRRRVSRRMVFWCGIAAILLALVMFNGSHSLYVHSKAAGGHYDRIVSLLDISAIIAVVAGCVALVVCHWIPDRRRRYAWRRPNRDRG
jgi:hypothetical protein